MPENRRVDRVTTATPRGGLRRTAAYAAGGAGIILLATGIGFGVRALELASHICPYAKCPADQRSTYDSFETSATVANITIGIGIVSVAAGALLLLTERHPVRGRAALPAGPGSNPGLSFVF